MKINLVAVALLVVLGLGLGTEPSYSFNSGTHIYIAERVFPNCFDKINLYYGSIAPDLDMFVSDQLKWPTAFEDTHWIYIDLRPYAWTSTQKAFAKGWWTHSEKQGADKYAHGPEAGPPVYNYNGYVIEKAKILLENPNPDPLMLDFAHSIIETGIDLLVKYRLDPKIGKKLLDACLFRSWEDRNLLVRTLVLKYDVTDWATLAQAELLFREVTIRYALALSLPAGKDIEALSELISEIAETYGLDIPPEEIVPLLQRAITCSDGPDLLCDDFQSIINEAIAGIKAQK